MTEFGRIYIIRNTVNSKVYVGQTITSVRVRFRQHKSSARCGGDYVIGKAIRKYGEDKFYVETLEECLVEELNEREKYWIDFYKATSNKFGYNMSIGGNVTQRKVVIDENKVLRLFSEGMPAFKIARTIHTDIPKVTAILKKYNVQYGLDLQKVNSSEVDEYEKLYAIGYSTTDIANKFNRNKSTVRRNLIKRGIKLRGHEETKNLGRNLPTLD